MKSILCFIGVVGVQADYGNNTTRKKDLATETHCLNRLDCYRDIYSDEYEIPSILRVSPTITTVDVEWPKPTERYCQYRCQRKMCKFIAPVELTPIVLSVCKVTN